MNHGKFTSRGEWIHPERCNKTTELIVVTEGSFGLEIEGTIFELNAGDAIFIAAGEHHIGVGAADERVSFYWIHYDANGYAPSEKKLTLRDVYPVSILCRQIAHYAAEGFSGEVMDSLLCVLLAEIESQSGANESEDSLTERVSEWIRINSDRQISSGDVTERFGYSEDYLSRILKRQYGMSLRQFINDRRMRYLKYQLLETELTLTEIALRSGFTDCKLFLKFFRYHEGKTPSEFRKVYKSGHTNNR